MSDPADNGSDTEECCRQLKLLEDKYREARDRLADYMLASLKREKDGAAKPRLHVPVQANRVTPPSRAVARKSGFSLSLGCC